MKRAFVYICAFSVFLASVSCADMLDTGPSNQITGSQALADAAGAETAMNGVYRMMYLPGWGDNPTENFGQTAVQLMADAMAEDFVIKEEGDQWFVYDYYLRAHEEYTGTLGRSYAVWNFYYTLISNVNNIIASSANILADDPELGESVLGQAYALRAYCYFYLIQLFQQTYRGNEDAPGVPVYTEPTVAGSEGKPRGTVQDVYDRIDSDLETAVGLLQGRGQTHISHIDYYVAKGIQARVAMVRHDYKAAIDAASEALEKAGLSLASVEELGNFNDASVKDVMWGAEIVPAQSSQYMSLFSHLDADAEGMYASKERKCISTGLYSKIPDTDSRLAWFRGVLTKEEEQPTGSMASYCQLKFKMADYSTRSGDYIFMRAEEMVLIKAEAECHEGLYSDARTTLEQLGVKRDPAFAQGRISRCSDSSEYNENTNAEPVTLMEEILFQRRLELWGETGRLFDLQRLGLGYDRDFEGSNHMEKLQTKNTGPASPLFIFPLPQAEIDANENISDADQNPVIL